MALSPHSRAFGPPTAISKLTLALDYLKLRHYRSGMLATTIITIAIWALDFLALAIRALDFLALAIRALDIRALGIRALYIRA